MTWYTDPLLKNCRHIIIEDIQKEMMIGAYEHEKSSTQPVIINVELFVLTHAEDDPQKMINCKTPITTMKLSAPLIRFWQAGTFAFKKPSLKELPMSY